MTALTRVPAPQEPSLALQSGHRKRACACREQGYSVYRQVIGYYSGEEDAYDMRKPLSRDVDKKSCIPLSHPVYPDDID